MTTFRRIKSSLISNRNPSQAIVLSHFFKTGKGQYGEGDKFLGINVPTQRKIAKEYKSIELSQLEKLISNEYHECRFVALQILIFKYQSADNDDFKAGIVQFYLKNKEYINNWDLVDSSAPYILGNWLLDKKDTSILEDLAHSNNIWDKRIAMISTFSFIRLGRLRPALLIAKALLKDKHDLIHKAVGWMLREVGKKSKLTLVQFLEMNIGIMPRTTLRYAIEKFEINERIKYYNFMFCLLYLL